MAAENASVFNVEGRTMRLVVKDLAYQLVARAIDSNYVRHIDFFVQLASAS